MSAKTRIALVAVVATLFGILLGIGAVALVQKTVRLPTGSEKRLKPARQADDLQELEWDIAKRRDEYEAARSRLSSPSSLAEEAPVERVRQFAYIRRLVYGHPGQVSADYAQFLTGAAAIQASKKDGNETPPPNDYYIVNVNPRVRLLPVHPNASVKLTTKPGEGAVAEGYASDVKMLANYFSADVDEWAGFRADGYWLTIENGLVVAIEEQYTP